ncbi:MAG TPA: hypothetical protein P5102_11275 [Candidatus Competibacteraceae bacterium]|nr:hypothetical protein [Candidatus Competibacteraceae bacterium]HRZ06710.1 hypothetical protein [Candidatus Competibacteraceae bacterium]HSA45839.1 hypothetical protein [Candidatus Competibacteraceae bacterium]
MTTHPDALVASDYVVCATLRKIPDVFNVELLWERVRGGQEGVFLLEALKRYPRAPRARQRREMYYSQVIVRIPERDYIRDDRLEDSLGRRTLIRELQRLHEQELGRFLTENAVIRYRVEPDSALRPGEAQFLFGRAIYVPAEGETALFRIEAAAEGHGEWRDLGPIYPGQRLTLLNSDRRASSFAVMAWPFIGGESVLLMLRSGPSEIVDVVAEPPGCLTLTGDEAGGFLARDRRNRGLRLRVMAPAADVESLVAQESSADVATPVASLVRVPAVVPLAGSPELVRQSAPLRESEPSLMSLDEDYPQVDPWGRREPVLGISIDFDDPPPPLESDVLASKPTPKPVSPRPLPSAPLPLKESASLEVDTPLPVPAVLGMDQGTWIPRRSPACLKVMGVALQRLSTYAPAGISDWRLSFDRAGGLVLDANPEAAAWLRIDSADRVFGEVAGQSAPLEIPGVWQPFPELELKLYAVPEPMAGHYLGWMRLPTPLELPVPRGRVVSFGRGAEADIAPKLLADPRSLRWEGNPAQAVGISAEYLGLSRRHLCLQARRDDWWVQLGSQNMPAYRLTPSGDLLDVLTPGVNTATEVKPGELLVAGGYVLALGAVG